MASCRQELDIFSLFCFCFNNNTKRRKEDRGSRVPLDRSLCVKSIWTMAKKSRIDDEKSFSRPLTIRVRSQTALSNLGFFFSLFYVWECGCLTLISSPRSFSTLSLFLGERNFFVSELMESRCFRCDPKEQGGGSFFLAVSSHCSVHIKPERNDRNGRVLLATIPKVW